MGGGQSKIILTFQRKLAKMAREKKLVIGAINITIQPHTPQKYLELFRNVYKLKKAVNISGDQFGLLAGMHKLSGDQDEPGPITGDIFKYTDINRSAQWFNITTSKFASDDDVGAIYIPENLKPNSSRFSYIFFPEQHLMFYEGYYDGNSFGPTNAERFVERLLNVDEIVEKYGKVDVTHVPEADALADALKLYHKERIDLVIKRPNADTHAKTEQRVMKRMKAMNVGAYEQSYKAVQGQSIEMDDDLEAMSHVSAKNGSLYIKGKDRNFKPVEYSTINHPLKHTEYYDPDVEMAFEIFSRTATSLKEAITKWFRA
jgi:hypothetical protein